MFWEVSVEMEALGEIEAPEDGTICGVSKHPRKKQRKMFWFFCFVLFFQIMKHDVKFVI